MGLSYDNITQHARELRENNTQEDLLRALQADREVYWLLSKAAVVCEQNGLGIEFLDLAIEVIKSSIRTLEQATG